jgi:hypothetical protein
MFCLLVGVFDPTASQICRCLADEFDNGYRQIGSADSETTQAEVRGIDVAGLGF